MESTTLRARAAASLLLAAAVSIFSGCASTGTVSNVPLAPTVSTPGTPEQQEAAVRRALRVGDRADTDLIARHLAETQTIVDAPISLGNRVRLLVDGPATHAAMFDAIDGARRSVDVESYIIEDDEVGRRLADALVRKRAEGLDVNLLYDSLGSIGTPAEFFERLRQAGVRVCEFNPVSPWRARVPWNVNHRDHRKILVVDGQRGFTGGINFSSVYSAGSFSPRRALPDAKRGWRDTHVELQGPAVGQLLALYDDTWRRQRCEARPARPAAAVPVSQGKAAQVIGSGPLSGPSRMYVAFLSALRHAERTIYLTQAYFVPDQRTLDALVGAAGRGVDVRMVLPSFSDFWAPLSAGRSHYDALLTGGVRIFERQEALLHAKTAVIDGVWSTVGSANLDWRSFVHNEEANVVVFDATFGREMTDLFEADLARSVELTPQRWATRGPAERLKEWVARWFEYLL